MNTTAQNERSEPKKAGIFTVSEARKVLGKSYDKYSDEYIEALIQNLDGIAKAFIDTVPKY